MTENSSIIQKLQTLYQGLITLKEDRTTYIRTTDVLNNYDVLCDLLRAHEEQYSVAQAEDSNVEPKGSDQLQCKLRFTPICTIPRLTQRHGNFLKRTNVVIAERLLHDCFLLVSLLFLTSGKNIEPPATYALPEFKEL